MKTIHIERIRLRHFAGQRDQTFSFSNAASDIFGANRAGKTTLFNAFLWSFFGKDYLDRKDYGIKPQDEEGNDIHRLETEVETEIRINGNLEKFKKVYKEKWTTKKGTTVEEWNGHTTDHYWNDIAMSATEYGNKVANVVAENLFKLLSNPMFFNSDSSRWGWQNRREILIDMAGNISIEDVIKKMASTSNSFDHLREAIKTGLKFEEYRKQLGGSLKRQKEDCDVLPIRINEATRNLPKVLDWVAIERDIANTQKLIAGIEAQMEDATKAFQAKADDKMKLVEEKNDLLTKFNARRFVLQQNLSTSINTAKDAIYQKETTIHSTSNSIAQTNHEIKQAEQKISFNLESIQVKNATRSELNDSWQKLNADKFIPAVFNEEGLEHSCFNCHQDLPGDMKLNALQTQKESFQKNESDRLEAFTKNVTSKKNEIERQGNNLKSEIDVLQDQNKKLTENISGLKTKLSDLTEKQALQIGELEQLKSLHAESAGKDLKIELEAAVVNDTEAQDLRKKGLELNARINAMNEDTDPLNDQLKIQRNQFQEKLDTLKQSLADRDTITKMEERIDELEGQETALQNQIAELQRKINDLDLFERTKMNMVEESTNKRFSLVKWRLFDRQINGGESATCECLIKGVPFSHTNTESKVNAGLDVINALVDYYQISTPVFIDNRESVTKIIPVKSQVINLIVSEPDKTLRIVNEPGVTVSSPPPVVEKKAEPPQKASTVMQPVLDFD